MGEEHDKIILIAPKRKNEKKGDYIIVCRHPPTPPPPTLTKWSGCCQKLEEQDKEDEISQPITSQKNSEKIRRFEFGLKMGGDSVVQWFMEWES